MRATFLGCGDAFAIPRPACACPQCAQARREPREARTRSGLLLDTAAGRTLLDCSPDILRQLEREAVAPADVARVVISHRHHDHAFGLYDLARLRGPEAEPLRVHADEETQALLQAAFASLFRPERPLVVLAPWGPQTTLDLGDLHLAGFETHHVEGMATTACLLAFEHAGRAVRVAYATDMGAREPAPRARVADVDLFVGDGTYLGGPGHGHPGTDRVVALARGLGARRIALTHVGHWGLEAAEGAARVGTDVAICRDRDDLAPRLA